MTNTLAYFGPAVTRKQVLKLKQQAVQNYKLFTGQLMGRHDTQHDNIQHNDTQHNDDQHNGTQYNNKLNVTLRIMTLGIMALLFC